MGGIRIRQALNGGKKMPPKFMIAGTRPLLAWLCLCIFLAACTLSAAGQGTYHPISSTTQATDTSGPDRAYCVSNGYLYTSNPAVNGGKPICQFPDGSSCDAHAFFTGNCSGVGLASPYNPTFYSSQGALDLAAGTKECQRLGGGVQSVHTAYGDVNLCAFPGGNTMDLRELANGAFGYYGPYPYGTYSYGTYPYGTYPYYSYGPYGDNWYYWAYSWLNAP
jgi:putative hemolysin